jgi:hypothetical protein
MQTLAHESELRSTQPARIEELAMTAWELRDHVARLEAERALALSTGVAEIDAYLADLEQELRVCREAYTLEAVTEIASLRGELFGPQLG